MGTAAPAVMPTEDLEAAVAELPAKKDALREAFDRLAACSPYPLPFTWEELDAHVSSIHSSVSRRFRQLRVLEAARPTHTGKNQEGAKEEEELEEEEEEEVVEEEEEEEEGKEEEEEMEEEKVEEEEEMDEVEVEEEEEVEEEVEEVVEEEVEVEVEEEADKEMQDANDNVSNQAKGDNEGGEDEEQDADEEAVATKFSAGQDNEAEGEMQEVNEDAQEDKEEEQDTEEEMVVKMTKMSKKQLRRLPPGGRKDLVAACERMDAGMLAQFVICVGVILKKEFLATMCHAPDPAALVLQVVKLFLSSKKFKCTRVWVKCVMLIRWLPTVSAKPSADTTEEAKLVAKNWKQIIDRLECCEELDLPAAWGLLHFLISYNIVSVFNIHEIIRIFAMVRHKSNKKYTVKLCNDLGLTDRTTDLIDYLIGNGQHLEAFHLAQVFNLEDRYPLLSLLKGLIEKAKQTDVEIFRKNKTHKSLNLDTPKEVKMLRVARHLAEKELDSSQRSAIVAEIEYLLGEYAKKQSSAYPSTASTWNLQHEPKKHKQSNKKRKKEEQERQEGQDNQQPQGLNQNKLIQGNQHQLHQQGNEVQVTPQQQQHIEQPRQATFNLPTPAVPLVPNVAQIQNFGCPPYAAMPGVQSYPAQPGWPGAQVMPFAPQLRAPQYMGPPFSPFPPHPPFCPPHPPFCPR